MHKHHILPTHAGGTDDPSNIVYLSILEHAEAHRVLWAQHGRKGDRLAWLALSGQIGKEEIQRERSKLGAAKLKGRRVRADVVEKIRVKLTGKKRSPESIERIRKSQLGNTNCKGRKLNSVTKQKLSLFRTGTTLSEETKTKIAESLAGNKNGIGNKNRLRKKLTEESKQKISMALKESWKRKKVKN